MYQVIARKYRPQTFAELVSQEHVKTTLENAILQNRIAHGYIFSGQRGTGKTTVARILARCLNCVQGATPAPCGVCSSCLEIAAGNSPDVIEIDAASNRGINEMRELRENVRYRPSRDRYKIFIIDEAHQITSEAFNALLKTLEEPPEWVVFVLCTTESHKIPATIASRCQHFSFRSVEFEDVVARMQWICSQEGIRADAEVLAVLAQAGEGSVRDSLSALDQAIACCGDELRAADVRALLGAFSLDSLHQVTGALAASDSRRMMELVADLERNGQSLPHFCRELAVYFRNLIVARIAGEATPLIAASPGERRRLAEIAAGFSEEDLTRYLHLTLELYGDLQRSTQPRLHTEIGLLRMVQAGKLLAIEEALASLGGSSPPANPGQRPAPPSVPHAGGAGGWKARLHRAFTDLKMPYSADAINHSKVEEAPGGVRIEAPAELKLSLRKADLQRALQHLGASGTRVDVAFVGESAPAPAAGEIEGNEELTRRALSHPEVQRIRESLGGQVRAVRDLKE
ncbi:MAG: DNA polymerase III subunit gamma/tau [Bryobacterales bacterium]|nr:DNA polymerase III subunit gamma/tau [Bryobacterales bacterium]